MSNENVAEKAQVEIKEPDVELQPLTGEETVPIAQAHAVATHRTHEMVEEQRNFHDDPMLAMIERAAANPAFDIEKMRQLVAMRNEEFARRAKQEYAADFVRMKPNLPLVIETKSNTQTKSKYADLADINQVVDPILGEYGFGTSCKITQTATHVTATAELWHKGGHIETNSMTVPLDDKGSQGTVNKTGPHATLSSASYAQRGAIKALLNISAGEDKDGNSDKGGAVEPGATLPQQEAIKRLYDAAKQSAKDAFDDKYGEVQYVKRGQVDELMAFLKKHAKPPVATKTEKGDK